MLECSFSSAKAFRRWQVLLEKCFWRVDWLEMFVGCPGDYEHHIAGGTGGDLFHSLSILRGYSYALHSIGGMPRQIEAWLWDFAWRSK